jgi:protein AATF/BFR2
MPTKSILREIAKLSNPTPQDYDPEDIAPDFEPSDSDEDNNDAGREHYLEVGYAKFFPDDRTRLVAKTGPGKVS